MGSARLPGKVVRSLAGRPMLEWVLRRALAAQLVDAVVLAVPDQPESAPLREIALKTGCAIHAGSEDDVLGRVAEAAAEAGAGTVVVLTGDNPFIDPHLLDDVIRFHAHGNYDYTTTTHMDYAPGWSARRTFPRGVSVQVVAARVLAGAAREATDPNAREHSTLTIYNREDGRFRLGAFVAEGPYAAWRAPELRLTVDTLQDFELAKRVWDALDDGTGSFSTGEVIDWLRKNPEVLATNAGVEQRRPS